MAPVFAKSADNATDTPNSLENAAAEPARSAAVNPFTSLAKFLYSPVALLAAF